MYYVGFYAEPCQSKRGLRAKKPAGITNGSARQRRRRGELYSESAYRVAEDIMMKMMWIGVLRKVRRVMWIVLKFERNCT